MQVAVAPTPAAASAPATAKPAPSAPLSRPDAISALTTARMTGQKVQIAGMESATGDYWALPSGSIQATLSDGPVRMQRNNAWVPIDLTLQRAADGSIAPAAEPGDPVFAGAATGAGSHVLAAVGTGGNRVSITWTGSLPDPLLRGNTATYVGVRPGIDLVLTATRTGVEQDIVLESPAAIAELKGLNLPITAKNASSYREDRQGDVTLTNAAGKPFAAAPAMQMWDSRTSPSGDPIRRPLTAKVARRTAGGGLNAGVDMTPTPDLAWLESPSTVYPVTLDPTISDEATTFDTFVTQADNTDHSGDNDLQLGVTSGNITRSYLSWDMTGLAGKQITAATVYFYEYYSQSCTPAQWEDWLTTTANTTPAVTWATAPALTKQESTSTMTTGFSSSCDDGWIHIDGKNFFQDAANLGGSRGYMALRATDESATSIGFKQLRSRNATDTSQVPYAVVTYNSYPTVGSQATTPSTPCTTGSGRPYIGTKTPTLTAVPTDAESSASTVTFEWWAVGGSAKIGSAAVSNVASGKPASVAVPSGAFAEGDNYMWRVEANDGTGTGPWSSWCEFTIDSTAPSAAPTVTSTDYPAGGWAGSAGTAGTFTFGANGVADVASYKYGLDTTPPATSVTASALGGERR